MAIPGLHTCVHLARFRCRKFLLLAFWLWYLSSPNA